MNDYYYDEGEEEKDSDDYGEADPNYKYDKVCDNYTKISLRASTAPARPLTEIEEFRRSSDFLLLEHTVMCTSQFIQRPDRKYDIDSPEGQRACKRFLNQIEKMCEVFNAIAMKRTYRDKFSPAYKVLYKEGTLCYLTEILDSAQEGFPFLWMNGKKYEFTPEVLELGAKLFTSFKSIQNSLRNIYNKICDESTPITVSIVKSELTGMLEYFDRSWVDYESV